MGNSCQNPEKQRETMSNNVNISGPGLIVLGQESFEKNSIQFYSFMEKRWLKPQKIPDITYMINHESLILNDKLYYTTHGEHAGRYSLQVFDLATRRITKLRYPFIIMDYTAMCACSRFIYFCGGSLPPIDQALKYDPQTNSLETLPPMTTTRANAVAIFYQGYLHVLGGHIGDFLNSVEKYDPVARQWTQLPPMCKPRGSHAAAILNDKLYVCGGFKLSSVEVYDPATNRWQMIASMNQARSHFRVIAHEGKLYAVGGDDSWTIEVYDPFTDQWRIDNEMSAGLEIDSRRALTASFVNGM